MLWLGAECGYFLKSMTGLLQFVHRWGADLLPLSARA